MRITTRLVVGPMLVALLFGCDADNAPQPAADYDSGKTVKSTAQPSPSAKTATKPPAQAAPANARPPQAPKPSLSGEVLETMDAMKYTYVRVKTTGGDVWAAAPKTRVAVGDKVEVYGAMKMPSFHSKTLDRTFKEILFAAKLVVLGRTGASADKPAQTMPPKNDMPKTMPPAHPPVDKADAGKPPKKADPVSLKPGDIEKLAGGHTVAELFASKADLVGKTVKIRARVVKATRGIMGKNWMHIQDGTGEAGSNDVTVTSAKAFAPVGTTVLVEGTLQADKDIGAGYVFAVLIEDAKVTPESAKPAEAE